MYFSNALVAISLLKITLVVCFTLHWGACFWFYIGNIGLLINGKSWLNNNNVTDFTDSSKTEKYLASLYYFSTTITTVGYGDIYAVTYIERTISIALMIFATCFYAFAIGSIATIIANNSNKSSKYRKKLLATLRYLKNNHIDKTLIYKVKIYLEHVIKKKIVKSEAKDRDLIELLPKDLSKEVKMLLNLNTISSNNYEYHYYLSNFNKLFNKIINYKKSNLSKNKNSNNNNNNNNNNNKSLYYENAVIDKTKVEIYLKKNQFKFFSIFNINEKYKEFCYFIASKIGDIHLNPMEIIFNTHEKANCMYFVSFGSVQMFDNNFIIFKKLKVNNFFGEMGFFTKKNKRNLNAESIHFTSLLKLDKDMLFESLELYKNINRKNYFNLLKDIELINSGILNKNLDCITCYICERTGHYCKDCIYINTKNISFKVNNNLKFNIENNKNKKNNKMSFNTSKEDETVDFLKKESKIYIEDNNNNNNKIEDTKKLLELHYYNDFDNSKLDENSYQFYHEDLDIESKNKIISNYKEALFKKLKYKFHKCISNIKTEININNFNFIPKAHSEEKISKYNINKRINSENNSKVYISTTKDSNINNYLKRSNNLNIKKFNFSIIDKTKYSQLPNTPKMNKTIKNFKGKNLKPNLNEVFLGSFKDLYKYNNIKKNFIYDIINKNNLYIPKKIKKIEDLAMFNTSPKIINSIENKFKLNKKTLSNCRLLNYNNINSFYNKKHTSKNLIHLNIPHIEKYCVTNEFDNISRKYSLENNINFLNDNKIKISQSSLENIQNKNDNKLISSTISNKKSSIEILHNSKNSINK